MTSAPAHRRGSRLVVTVLAVLLGAGCRPGIPAPIVIAPPVAALTPFLPSMATPTAAVVRIWISPSVPPALKATFEEDVQRSGMKVEWADRADSATVQLRPSSGRPYASWTYAVVSAFPTLEDGLTWDALAARWKGTVVDGGPVWTTPDVQALLEVVLGPPAASAAGQPTAESLLDEVWASRPALAVIPFEELQPKWKVLEIDGISPVRKDFDGEGYPLQIAFGLDGDSAAIARLSQSMDLPTGPAQTNRKAEKLTIVVVTGVTALTRATAWRMEVRGVEYPAQLIGDWLREADITHVSNEVAFSPDCPAPTPDLSLLIFCSQPSHIALLDDIGTDVIELTGNHVLDAGTAAFQYSMDLYDERGWKTFGGGRDFASASQPALFEHNGNRLAFLGCNEAGPTSAWATAAGPGALPCGADRLQAEIGRTAGSRVPTDLHVPMARTLHSMAGGEPAGGLPGCSRCRGCDRQREPGASAAGLRVPRRQLHPLWTRESVLRSDVVCGGSPGVHRSLRVLRRPASLGGTADGHVGGLGAAAPHDTRRARRFPAGDVHRQRLVVPSDRNDVFEEGGEGGRITPSDSPLSPEFVATRPRPSPA